MQLQSFYKGAFSGAQRLTGIDKVDNRAYMQGRVIPALVTDPTTHTHTHARGDPF